MRAHGAAALREGWARDGVRALLRSAVADGAALGWVDPPAALELDRLLGEIADAAAAGDADAVLLAADGEVLAFGYWRRYGRPTHRPHADLERLVVGSASRRRGHGQRVLRALVASAGAAGVEVLTLDVRGDNVAALALYAAEGFAEYGRLPGFVAVGGARWDKVLLARRLREGQPEPVGDARPEAGPAPAVEGQPTGGSGQVTDHLVGWAVLQRGDGRVLLARRAGVSYASGLWGPPGGHVEDGETLAAGTVRELREEVGVCAAVDELEPLGVTRYVDGPHRGTDFFFLVRRWEGDPSPVSECSEVGWFDPEDLPDDALPWLTAALRRHLLERRWLADEPAG